MHTKPAKIITRKQADILLFAHIFKTLTRFLEQGMLLIFSSCKRSRCYKSKKCGTGNRK